jgi:uncharacterized membrane protein YdjX (TVP38/TMEM64 family)
MLVLVASESKVKKADKIIDRNNSNIVLFIRFFMLFPLLKAGMKI